VETNGGDYFGIRGKVEYGEAERAVKLGWEKRSARKR
jgi:hypothetical protein